MHSLHKPEFHKALRASQSIVHGLPVAESAWAELINMQISRPHPRPTESESLGIGLRNLLL